MSLTVEQKSELLQKWNEAKKGLDYYKDLEVSLRKQVTEEFFGENLKEGSGNKIPLSDGFILQATVAYRREVDNEVYHAIANDLSEQGVDLARLVTYSPKLSTSEYKKLSEEARKIFDSCVETKVGSPSIKIVQPKRK